jgi:hypothetical protein
MEVPKELRRKKPCRLLLRFTKTSVTLPLVTGWENEHIWPPPEKIVELVSAREI